MNFSKLITYGCCSPVGDPPVSTDACRERAGDLGVCEIVIE